MRNQGKNREGQIGRRFFLPPLFAALMLAAIVVSRGMVTSYADPIAIEVIQQALENLPPQLGEEKIVWIQTREVAVPTGQAQLLGLSAFLSREYRRLQTFPSVTAILFIAHCADSRSMSGHHPPNCYPSSGWTLNDDQNFVWKITRPDGKIMEAKAYFFTRTGDLANQLWVVNGFFLSDNFFAATLEDAEQIAKPSLLGGTGLSQFQILLQGDFRAADVRKYGTELLQGIPSSLFDVIAGELSKTEESLDLGASK
jgi:hypothetical protein